MVLIGYWVFILWFDRETKKLFTEGNILFSMYKSILQEINDFFSLFFSFFQHTSRGKNKIFKKKFNHAHTHTHGKFSLFFVILFLFDRNTHCQLTQRLSECKRKPDCRIRDKLVFGYAKLKIPNHGLTETWTWCEAAVKFKL